MTTGRAAASTARGCLSIAGGVLAVVFVIFVVFMAVFSGIEEHTSVSPTYLEGEIEDHLGPLVGPDPSASCPNEVLPDRVGASTTCTLTGSRTTRVSATVTAIDGDRVSFDLRQLDLPGQEPSGASSFFEPHNE